ncbi:MAG: ribose-5-phosphate isomerase RpiA [Parachlamydiaceae bacterium]|nr:ribose-5-phosphate isomerase RpiA [Parachlamydiaceae bacterium]
MPNSNEQIAKKAVGKVAAELIKDEMIVGLGTGSTAAYFIDYLIARCREGLKISAIATSEHSEQQARKGGIPILDINALSLIDVVVDGADEIDRCKRMIKGGGGALLREKIVANMAREMIVIVDENKVVKHLGAFPLPVEIVAFAHEVTFRKIQACGYAGAFRLNSNGNLYLTDNGNYIVDIKFATPLSSPEKDNEILHSIPGVVETGFFFNLAGRVLVGHDDGSVNTIVKESVLI